jgi:hypothetical protein
MARWLCLGGAAGWTLRADLDAAHCAFAFGLANGLALSVIFALCCWSLKSDGARTAKADEPQTARRLDA